MERATSTKTNSGNKITRSREMIVTDMLKAALEPIRKTHIMYKANLSYDQLVQYIQYLAVRQLVETRDGLWVTTSKGREYLQHYQMIEQVIA